MHYRKSQEGYDTAQVCLNGHTINSMINAAPQHNQKFCGKCGTQTLTACPECNADIRGHYSGVFSFYRPPAFCHECGKAYPWTAGRLQAARDLTAEMEKLDSGEREALSKSLDDLVRETPQTPVAVTRFKKLMAKVGSVGAENFKKILVEVATEAVKKQLWP
jgi:hypothetical protein